MVFGLHLSFCPILCDACSAFVLEGQIGSFLQHLQCRHSTDSKSVTQRFFYGGLAYILD